MPMILVDTLLVRLAAELNRHRRICAPPPLSVSAFPHLSLPPQCLEYQGTTFESNELSPFFLSLYCFLRGIKNIFMQQQ